MLRLGGGRFPREISRSSRLPRTSPSTALPDAILISTRPRQRRVLLRGRALMAERLERIGTQITRYGLVIVLLWIGGMKFTAYEAEGIEPLVANSPLMGWVYGLTSV